MQKTKQTVAVGIWKKETAKLAKRRLSTSKKNGAREKSNKDIFQSGSMQSVCSISPISSSIKTFNSQRLKSLASMKIL